MSKNKKIIIAVVSIIVLVIIAGRLFKGGEEVVYHTIVAERVDLVQKISATGRVEAVESINLAFENSGRVSRAYVEIGDKVNVGDVLIVLENLEEMAQIAQAKAALAKNQAKLAELNRGVRPEEILVQEIKVSNAKSALKDAKRNLVDELQGSYTKSDDAVRNKTDQLFSNPRTSNPQLNFVTDSNLKNSIELERSMVEEILKEWEVSLGILNNESNLDTYTEEANRSLAQVKSLLDKAGLAVNSLTLNSYLTQATIDAWKLDVYTGRINVNTAITNITAADEKVGNAKSALALAEQELALKESGTTKELIIAQEAQIKESDANIRYYQAQLRKTIIESPINGIVTIQDAKIGAIVPANTTIVSVISDGEYQIEAFIVEADIANLEVGNVATLLLDAYGEDETFTATVVRINPAAELFEGVANYRTILRLQGGDSKIRAGMTADLDIITAKRENVVSILERAVIFKNDMKIVRILEDGVLREVEVETGIVGERGQIEIISGVVEGDVVVTSIRE